MLYIFIAIIIIGIFTWLVKSSVKHGWIFIVLGFIGFGIFMSNAQSGTLDDYIMVAFGIMSLFGGVVLMVLKIDKDRKRKNIDNTAYIPEELRKTQRGFVFGKIGDKHIIKPESEDGHILVVGGVGSGKSSCLAIPTLRAWKSRVFAIDIKGELYEQTNEYRKNIYVFDPTDKNSFGYDPYFFIRDSPNPAQEASAIAEALIPLPPDVKEPFWIEGAQSILTAAILHYYESKSFLDTLMTIQESKGREILVTISESKNQEAKMYISKFVDASDKTLAGFFLVLSKRIEKIVTDNEIKRMLSKRDNITPQDLEENHDIYIKTPEKSLRQWKNLLTLMINQFLRFFEERAEKKKNAPILFLIDEFPRLGKFPDITDGLATLRSKKITFCIIIQSLPQLDDIYGRTTSKVICDLCSYQAVLSVSEADSQDTFSRLFGTYEKSQESQSENFFPGFGLPIGRGKQKSPTEKRKIKPEDFATLVRDKKLVLITPLGNFIIDKQAYWE